MGFRTIGYSITSAATTFTAATCLTDDTITKIDSTHYKVPAQNLVLASYGYGTHLNQYQIKTPSLSGGNKLPVEIDDVDKTATQPTVTTPPLVDFSAQPVHLVNGEGLEADILTDGTSAAAYVVYWLGDGMNDFVEGQFMPGVRATSSTTLSAGAWTNCTLTFDYSLPAGGYAVVGMRAESATGIAARLAFPELGPRPGVLAGTATAIRPNFRATQQYVRSFPAAAPAGRFISWGSFVQDSPPSVDFLAVAADTAEQVVLDLVKIA